MTEIQSGDLIAELDEASLSRFHLRAVLVSGMGFFTDAYDLFVIGIASTLIAKEWNLSSGKLALLNSTMLAAAFLGALVFGRFADVVGRKRVYWMVAAIMVIGALGSALAPSFWILIVFRFVLGFGVGGDYPVSAVMMSEYANRKDRGKLVGMVFGTQALGLIVGPLIALALIGGGASDDVVWRILLGLGALPAAAVLYLRTKMPESPRYRAQVQGRAAEAATQIAGFTRGQVNGNGSGSPGQNLGLRAFLTNRRYLIMLAGTAGTWFLLDYAYYGNTISTPQILGLISPQASTPTGHDRPSIANSADKTCASANGSSSPSDTNPGEISESARSRLDTLLGLSVLGAGPMDRACRRVLERRAAAGWMTRRPRTSGG